MRITTAILLVIASVSSPAWSNPTAAELAAVSDAEATGSQMYAYDQAAWHATDRFMQDLERRGVPMETLLEQGFEGYIVEPGETGDLVATFFGSENGEEFAVARYTIVGSDVTAGGMVPPDGERTISLLAHRMIAARRKAIDALVAARNGLCSESPPNTLVLPPRTDGVLPVYILSSTTENGIYPAGGHYRFDFDGDGQLISDRGFMKTCMNIDYRERDGERPVGFGLSHLLDPQPTEIHAFVSRYVPLELTVITTSNRKVWRVSNGDIEYDSDFPAEN